MGAGVIGAAVVAAAAPEFNTARQPVQVRFDLCAAELTSEQRAFAGQGNLPKGASPRLAPFNINLRSPEMAELAQPYQRTIPALQVADSAQVQGNRHHADLALLGRAVLCGTRTASRRSMPASSATFITAMAAGERPAKMSSGRGDGL